MGDFKNNIIYRFTPKPNDNITGEDDIADEYVVEQNDDAYAGLVIYGKYQGRWVTNPSARAVVRQLLIESKRLVGVSHD